MRSRKLISRALTSLIGGPGICVQRSCVGEQRKDVNLARRCGAGSKGKAEHGPPEPKPPPKPQAPRPLPGVS
jgi:hypothetical protein